MRFLDLDRGGQHRIEHRQAFVTQLLHHLCGQTGAGLKLVDHDAFDFQFGVVIGANFGDVLHQRVQGTTGKIVAVEWDQAGISGDQG